MLKEQKGKSSKNISPNSLQNPTDPDATYRKKGKKKHIGYTTNIIEKFDDNNRMIEGKRIPTVIRNSLKIPLKN